MNEPPSKRRRTDSPDDRASSPLRKPPRRPSYASPTKSQLARNYPNLLPSRRSTLSASPRRPRPAAGQNGLQKEKGSDATLGARESAREQENGSFGTPLEAGDDDESELPGTPPSQESFEGQHQQREDVLFSSPSKRAPRAKGIVKQQPPLRQKAPAVQSDDITRTFEDGPTQENIQGDTQLATQQTQPPDPAIGRRKQEKARLQRQVEDLEAEISRCAEEIGKEQRRAPDEALSSKERDDLTAFISKLVGSDTESEKPAPTSTLLCSFLPFAALRVPQPRPKQPAKPIPSHRPLDLADPLPYLEMFTSLNFSSQLSLPRSKILSTSKRVHQKHTIDITGPQKLLTAQIAITIDGLAHEVADMQVLRLSPWAERELGSFVRARAQEKDIGNAAWAVDSYWELAKKRAQHWRKCETAFAHLLAGSGNEDAENDDVPKATAKTAISRKDLNRNLGRDTLVLQDEHVLLKLNWRIGFDWTGEAESDVTVEAAFPKVWSETDTGASLKKVPETFVSLLRTKGAFGATRIMVALLFAQ
ncbi:hypothetical protein CFE70_009900 [Pyrenophora teres f. teres 0-1]|uniref:BRLZ domain containing protein n=1 Tax=Pyrenophora teres f. teres (strain 0-1) TaxID=861557 RepID=E3RKK3_PYRTT|nr:hypothetical protein PTT_08768 [Pyrenophora teres f. teres 0-1]KAE8836981.1 hypothetical protein HRS9122_07136 [Pyrenophora teres f. teres]KAE8860275.1 hypothetical protein PTNB73_07885 [Pyrenophora teres f. teres]